MVLHAQEVGIGTTAPQARMDIDVPTSYTGDLLRVAIGTDTPLFIKNNSNVGIRVNNPVGYLNIAQLDAGPNSVGDGASLVLGNINGKHMELDNNEIHAMDGTGVSKLHFNGGGGDVSFFNDNPTGGNVGIGVLNPLANLHISSTAVDVMWSATDATVDNENWSFTATSTGLFQGQVVRDDATSNQTWVEVERSGVAVTDVSFPNGNVGIGTTSPDYRLHITNDGMIYAEGTRTSGTDLPSNPSSSQRTAFIWNPKRAAIRAGEVTGTQWDPGSVGDFTVAFGRNTKASGWAAAVGGGGNNTASGSQAVVSGGWNNTASGLSAVVSGGQNNTASGNQSLVGGGMSNTASGYASAVLSGYSNSATAPQAVVAGGSDNSVAGSYALAFGRGMILSNNANYTFAFGYSWPSTTTITDSNLFLIGPGGNVIKVGIGLANPSYQLQLSLNSAAKPTSNAWAVTSDARLKKDVSDYTEGLSVIEKIHPVWFTYTGEAGMPTDERGVGVLAQELQEVAPYMVSEWTYTDPKTQEKTNYLAVDNGAMTYMLINAVKELKKQNEGQQATIRELTQRLGAVEALLNGQSQKK